VVTGAELTLSLTSLISLSLPTSRRGRNIVGLGFWGFVRAGSERVTAHYRLVQSDVEHCSGGTRYWKLSPGEQKMGPGLQLLSEITGNHGSPLTAQHRRFRRRAGESHKKASAD
jgi:hypothetical protein